MLISLENAKTYKTITNLQKALARLGLDNYEGCRYLICRTDDGGWTAVFLVTEYLNKKGGYAGFASQHGFVSV